MLNRFGFLGVVLWVLFASCATAEVHRPLADARRFYGEHSYQLAVEKADAVLESASSSPEEKREARWLKGRSLAAMHRWPEAREEFAKLTEPDGDDIWAGRAHWWLEPNLHPGSYAREPTSAPLEHLTRAERILSREKAEDLAEFYRTVLFALSRIHLPPDARDKRAYLFSFFDRVSPLLKTDEERAEVLMQKAVHAGYVEGKPDPAGMLEQLESVVREFRQTEAAAQAQFAIARQFAATGDLVRAREEYKELLRSFPDAPQRKEAAQLLAEITEPQVYFSASGSYAPGEPIRFELRTRNVSEVQLQAIKWDPADWLSRERSPQLELEKVQGRTVRTETISTDKRDDLLASTASVELKFDEPGAYVLKAEAGASALCYAFVLVTDLALVTNQGHNQLECWVVDARTGHPRPGAEVIFASNPEAVRNWFGRSGPQKFTDVDRQRTDTDGFASFTPSRQHSQCFAVARDGEHFALMSDVYWYSPSARQDHVQSYVYTDRPAYRPEQKVHWRAILREQKDGEIGKPAADRFTAEIHDPRGNRMAFNDQLRPGEFGTISGELVLPAGAPLGEYRISIRGSAGMHSAQGSFRVEEYKKPEYEVSVKAGEKLARIGEEVEARVSATYYFGAPVTDAEVKYTVRRRPHWTWWPSPTQSSDTDLGWFAPPQPSRGPMHNSGGDIVASGEGRTDADGTFRLKFKAEVPETSQRQAGDGVSRRSFGWWHPPQTNTYDFQIEVTVTDKSRRNIDASQTIIVSDRALKLSVQPAQQLYTPGDVVKATLRARTYNDDPVATSGTLHVEKVRWLAESGKEEITTLTTERVDIPASGTLLTRWRVPAGTAGYLRFLLVVDDPFGQKSSVYGSFAVADENTRDIHYKYEGLQIITDRETYEVGDTARMVVLSEFPDAYAWYWIDAGPGKLVKKVLPLPHRTNFLTIPITEQLVPNCMVHLVVVRDRKLVQDSKELVVPPTRKVMTVEVRPSRETYKPGEQGEVEIIARDYQGRPVRAEFSLSVFDKSVLYIAPDQREDIRRAFYGERRPLRSDIRNSLATPGQYAVCRPGGTTWLFHDGQDHTGRSDYAFDTATWFANDRMRRPRRAGEMAPRETGMLSPAGAPPPAMAAAEAMVADGALAGASPQMAKGEGSGERGEAGELVSPHLRSDFRDSMFWSPAVVTDADGRALIKVTFPDSLTTWRMTAVGVDTGYLAGNDTNEVQVQKNLLVRLQVPRFFRERDRVTLSANVHNYLSTTKTAEVRLESLGAASGEPVLVPRGTDGLAPVRLTIPPGEEARADWVVDVQSWGDTTLRAAALTDQESDAMELKLPALPHGIDKFVAWNGSSDGGTSDAEVVKIGDSVTITQMVSIPRERMISSTRLQVLLSPSLAACLHDAVPYLIDYPYGCVEQTMSRFMPAAVVASTFRQLNFPPSPTLDQKLPEVIERGLSRLSSFQHGDGGWGWWKNDDTNAYMTAYVLYGLTLAREADVALDEEMFRRGLNNLQQHVQSFRKGAEKRSEYRHSSDLHGLMYQVFVLQLNGRSSPEVLDHLWSSRDDLTPHGLALLARTLWRANRQEDARTVLRNMHNVVVVTPENGTARWGLVRNSWYWWHDAVESTAQGLIAHLEIDPQSPLAAQAMKWLVLNREGNRWKSTKDTGQAILALATYMKAKGETLSDMTVQVQVSDLPPKTFTVTPRNLWTIDMRHLLQGDAVPDGRFPVTMTVEGKGTLFYSIFADYFTREEGITRAGNEIYVERAYEKLVRRPVSGTTATAAVDTYVPIADGEPLTSGDELRVTLRIKSLNDYEYLVFEDPKPAGMEPVELQSGTRYGGLCSNMELRDQHVAFFITHLPQGSHTIQYNCRAEIPGVFHTMPTTGYAMYSPPLRANSDEKVIAVDDVK